ncbi:hypothetical protein RMATCC62417_07906 [Rhizopus microsporus]|nr:hypothetical protein RMATCC62417_07906 [Rhizopus microsporus]
MGLLNFKKSSRKQGQKPSPANPVTEPDRASILLHEFNYSSPTIIPKPSETSLMDDIMQELAASSFTTPNDSSRPTSPVRSSPPTPRPLRAPLLQFDQAPQSPSSTNSPTTPNDNTPVVPTIHAVTSASETRVVPPRPLISFTNQPNVHSDDDDSDSDSEVQQRPQVQPHPVLRQRHSAPLSNKTLMTRMKERHRQEVRKTLASFKQEGICSSPSMPVMLSEKPRTLVQSQSFIIPSNNSPFPPMQPQGRLVRSTSVLTNMMPIQTQSDITVLTRHPPLPSSPSFIRQSFVQSPVHTLPVTTEEDEEEQVSAGSKKFQINRSVSAYPSFPQAMQEQQQIIRQQQQEEMKLKIELQEIKRQQELQFQQEIQRRQQQVIVQQQQQLQQLQQQQQLMIQQQQFQQQQQQQQILLQQQQIHKLQQSSLEMAKAAATAAAAAAASTASHKSKPAHRPLYERSSGTHKHKQNGHDAHHHNHHHHHDHHCSHNNSNSPNNKLVVMPHVVPSSPFTPEFVKYQNEHNDDEEDVYDEESLLSPTTVKVNKSARSSTSTLILKEEPNEPMEDNEKTSFKLPIKLKRELEDMQLSRSIYSVPNLSSLLTDVQPSCHRALGVMDAFGTKCAIKKETKIAKETTAMATGAPVYLYYLNDCHHNHHAHHCHKEHHKKVHKKHHHCHRSSSKYTLVEGGAVGA